MVALPTRDAHSCATTHNAFPELQDLDLSWSLSGLPTAHQMRCPNSGLQMVSRTGVAPLDKLSIVLRVAKIFDVPASTATHIPLRNAITGFGRGD